VSRVENRRPATGNRQPAIINSGSELMIACCLLPVACLLLLLAAACGRKAAAPPTPDAARRIVDAAPSPHAADEPDATPTPFAGDPSAERRALGAALAAVDPDDRATIDRAAAALAAWDKPGAALPIGCNEAGLVVARLVSLVPALAGDPASARSLAHAAQALRDADNAAPAIAGGVLIAKMLATKARASLAGLEPEPDVLFRVARAEARCDLASVPLLRAGFESDPEAAAALRDTRREAGMSAGETAVDDELSAYEAFVRDTMAAIDAAHTDDDLTRALEKRRADAEASKTSSLLHGIGAPFQEPVVASALAAYRKVMAAP
jgi:hypothetical protein